MKSNVLQFFLSLELLLLTCPSMAMPLSKEPIRPLVMLKVDTQKAALGKSLFEDKRLSKDGTVACVSCHSYQTGGVDNLPVSTGIRGQQGVINAPTVFNAANNFVQFWDGRARNLEEQAGHVINNPKEFDSSFSLIIQKLSKDSVVVAEFKKLYPEGLSEPSIRSAIAEFERTLITPSRFDQYLQGDANAINDQEKNGYKLFKSYGCIACHQGQNVGGNMFQVFGAMNNYFADRKTPPTNADNGRYNVTHKESDRHMFKVPSLRNVALTAPYFHDASAATLEQAINTMFKYQLGRTAPQQDKEDIAAFLKSLTGQHVLMNAKRP